MALASHSAAGRALFGCDVEGSDNSAPSSPVLYRRRGHDRVCHVHCLARSCDPSRSECGCSRSRSGSFSSISPSARPCFATGPAAAITFGPVSFGRGGVSDIINRLDSPVEKPARGRSSILSVSVVGEAPSPDRCVGRGLSDRGTKPMFTALHQHGYRWAFGCYSEHATLVSAARSCSRDISSGMGNGVLQHARV
jgi:hypothetical protein